jgi:hypothetical protein
VAGTAGLPFERIANPNGVVQMSRLGKDHALMLVKGSDGKHNLETIELP